ncbi:MAG TPA: alpha-glucan family phosphorylase [Puia sp.]|nr:alpha-glucan family phosphorylase [Puia sp.]
MGFSFSHPYTFDPAFQKKVAYFSMEFGIHQPLKTYAGGLGFLAGSHMRSAFQLRQNMVGISILWKYGYYDQVRKQDQTMDVLFEEKQYGFLEETGIKFIIKVSGHDVWVTAYYLHPEIFKTVPLFFLSTDLPENDYLAKTISHKLYDSNPETKIAAAILLGAGGARLLELINWEPEIYHLNESHGLPLAFYLYNKYKKADEVKKRMVFTNHTPEESGNQKTSITLLDKMSFFLEIPITEIRTITRTQDEFLDHTLASLRLSSKANGVSKLHLKTLQNMWGKQEGICNISSITNAQDFEYWNDQELYEALKENNIMRFRKIKSARKQDLFEIVADQCGEIYNEKICTIVFAKRFTGFKRPDLLFYNMERFHQLVTNKERPVQIIWAGKPYPMDYAGIGTFDKIVDVCKKYFNCSILVGYELKLSRILKRGADVWLNVPRLKHEASGTSGMTAAMNGAVNVSTPDGWMPEFAKDKINSFILPMCDTTKPDHMQDEADAEALYHLLESEVLPMYYDYPDHWLEIIKHSMNDIIPQFDSKRLAKEYYEVLYAK